MAPFERASTVSTLALLLAASATAQVVHDVTGTQAYARFGRSLAALGDVDGDGWPDLLVGAPDEDGIAVDAGAAHLLSGRTGVVIRTHGGVDEDEQFGWAVAAAGDLDADGVDDYLVTSLEQPLAGGGARGAISAYSGIDGSRLYQIAVSDSQQSAFSVAGCGDLDRDGFDDFAVGAPYHVEGASAGAVFLVSGRTGTTIRSLIAGIRMSRLGSSVASVEDLDGDGVRELLGGAPGADSVADRGVVFLYSGATGAVLHEFWGDEDVRLGNHVGPAGDLDGDGSEDYLLGSYEMSLGALGQKAGRMEAYSSATGARLLRIDGAQGFEFLGSCAAPIGDRDQDGIGDFVLGVSGTDSVHGESTGEAWIVSGASGDVLARFPGAGRHDLAGWAVASLGDVTGDGQSEIVVGSYGYDGSGAQFDLGRIWILEGPNARVLEMRGFIAGQIATLEGSGFAPHALVYVGYSLAGPGPTATPWGPAALSAPIRVVPPVLTTSGGEFLLPFQIPAGTSGLPVWVQALDHTPGALSRPLAVVIG